MKKRSWRSGERGKGKEGMGITKDRKYLFGLKGQRGFAKAR